MGAYNKLQEHLELDDIEHFVVNHKRHYVDPITGAHTQLIEGTWKQCKDTLPNGMDPKDLNSYLGVFMWRRYAKQRNLDLFVFFLKCASDMSVPFKSHFIRPVINLDSDNDFV